MKSAIVEGNVEEKIRTDIDMLPFENKDPCWTSPEWAFVDGSTGYGRENPWGIVDVDDCAKYLVSFGSAGAHKMSRCLLVPTEAHKMSRPDGYNRVRNLNRPKASSSSPEIDKPKNLNRLTIIMLLGGLEDRNEHAAMMAASEKLVEKYGVFDLKRCTYGLQKRICNKSSPCPVLVFLYAAMGLHRYNLLRGTKFQLRRVKKYIFSTGAAAATYYITLNAMDPAGLQTFQTKVSEECYGQFILTCNIARIRGETTDDKAGLNIGCRLPECPPENPFEIYYLMKDSELQDNDWIRLYLELAIATTDRNREASDFGLSNLEIVSVAIDANDGEGLLAKNAIFYIRYQDLYMARLGEDFDLIAIVRRSFNKDTGCFSLMGQIQSSDIIPKNAAGESME